MNHCAKFVFFEYWDKGSLPLKVCDCEGFDDWLDEKERERFIYRMIDAESNVFTISSKKIEQTMFFKIINGTTNEPILTKIEGEDLIRIREFYYNKEGTEKDK